MKKKLVYGITLVSLFAILAMPLFVHSQSGLQRLERQQFDEFGIPIFPDTNNNSGSGFGGVSSSGGGASGSWDNGPLDIPGIINRIAKWLNGFLIAVAAIFIVVAAFMYLTSGGNTEKVQTATRMIFYTVVAIGVAALASVIVALAKYFVGR